MQKQYNFYIQKNKKYTNYGRFQRQQENIMAYFQYTFC